MDCEFSRTEAMPGTEAKISVLTDRVAANERDRMQRSLFHADDGAFVDSGLPSEDRSIPAVPLQSASRTDQKKGQRKKPSPRPRHQSDKPKCVGRMIDYLHEGETTEPGWLDKELAAFRAKREALRSIAPVTAISRKRRKLSLAS